MGIEFAVREEVIDSLRDYVISHKNSNIKFCDFDKGDYSMNDILTEIESRSELGKDFYEAWERIYDADNQIR